MTRQEFERIGTSPNYPSTMERGKVEIGGVTSSLLRAISNPCSDEIARIAAHPVLTLAAASTRQPCVPPTVTVYCALYGLRVMVCSRVSPFASVTVAVSGNRALKFVVPGRAHNSMSPFVSCWHEHRVTSSSSAPVTTNSKGGAIFRCLAEESISKMLRARSAASSYSSELIGSSARPDTQGSCAGRFSVSVTAP